MFLHIADARYIEDYKVEVFFNNGRKGIADLSGISEKKAFASLKDKSVFSALKVDSELATIVWPDGLDLAPEYIYYKAFQGDPSLRQLFKSWGYIS